MADEVAAFFSLDYRLVSDPYPLYKRLRQEAPVFRHADKVLISRYGAVREIQTRPEVHQGLSVKGSRFRAAAAQVSEEDRQRLTELFAFFEQRVGGTNGEHHRRLRRLAQKAFTPGVVGRMESRIEAIADQLIADVATDEPVEFINAYAFHLPLIVMCEMLDIPAESRADLRRWTNSVGKFVGEDWRNPAIIAEGHESVLQLKSHLTSVFDERKNGEPSDLLGALIAAEADGDRFTEEELVAMIMQFVFAGHETSTMFLGNALVTLLTDRRDAWEELCQDSSLLPQAVEELLRFVTPSHNMDKLAAEDLEVDGVPILKGDTINVMLASANHDEGVFDEPERLDIHRASIPHVTFGRGPHHCLGASLARLEAQVSLRLLTQQFPDMRMATDTVQWRSSHMNRGPETLPVVLGRRRSE